MEHIHGIDVSWMTHGSAKGWLSSCSQSCKVHAWLTEQTTRPQNPPAAGGTRYNRRQPPRHRPTRRLAAPNRPRPCRFLLAAMLATKPNRHPPQHHRRRVAAVPHGSPTSPPSSPPHQAPVHHRRPTRRPSRQSSLSRVPTPLRTRCFNTALGMRERLPTPPRRPSRRARPVYSMSCDACPPRPEAA